MYKARVGDGMIILISAHLTQPLTPTHTAPNVLLWPASAALSFTM